MGKYNEILVGRYNRFTQKLFQMKGGAPVPQLAGDIQISMPLFSGVENRFLESWTRFGVGRFINAQGVGVAAGGRLINGPGVAGNVMVVIEKLAIVNPIADTLLLEYLINPATLATAARGFTLDGRQSAQSSAIWSEGNANAGGGGVNIIDQITVAANTRTEIIFTDIQEIALTPGTGLNVRAGITNQTLTVTMWWRERFLEESERT